MALRVLLADESTTIKKVMQLSLQDFAVEVKSVGNGLDVLTVTKTFKPDIIFVDILLPKRNGYEVCHELKSDADTRSVPVVLMWSGFMELDEMKAGDARADRRLEKPFDADTLRKIVRSLVTKTNTNAVSDYLQFPRLPDFDESASTPPPAAARPATPPQSAPQIPTSEQIANSQVRIDISRDNSREISRPNSDSSSAHSSLSHSSPSHSLLNLNQPSHSERRAVVDEKWLQEPEPESFEAFSIKSPAAPYKNESFQALNLNDSKESSPPTFGGDFSTIHNSFEPDELGSPNMRENGEFTEISFGEDDLGEKNSFEPSFRNQRERFGSQSKDEGSSLRDEGANAGGSFGVNPGSQTLSSDLNSLILNRISESDIQKTIEIQVQRVVEDVCWKLLPDMIERVVRDEINKLMKAVDDEFKLK